MLDKRLDKRPNKVEFVDRLKSSEWEVRDAPIKDAQSLVKAYHYARGGSNTAVFVHGLYRVGESDLLGIVWWLPPTRVACESVNKVHWKSVLSLTRMVVVPGVPKNACSFLLSRSVRAIKKDGRFCTLVTYSDESQGHLGGVYRACNWQYVGRTGPYPRWIDPRTGRQVSQKATVSRTKTQMESLGYIKEGVFHKNKFVLHLRNSPYRISPNTAKEVSKHA